MKKLFLIIGFFLIVSLGAAVQAQSSERDQPVVTIVYIGEKGDFGFIDQSFAGLNKAKQELHFKTREIVRNDSLPEVDPVVENETGIRADMVVMLGDTMTGYAQQVSQTYPDVPLVLIDVTPVPGSNVTSITFSMDGASYLAGILAANQTKTGNIAVIAGKNAPGINRFTDGFVEGANQENQNVSVNITYLAEDSTGFNMPDYAGEIAENMYRNGTDIIFTVAGKSGLGAITAANNLTGLQIIGVDSDQSALGPDVVLASVVKNMDAVVYREVIAGLNGSFTPGVKETGLETGGSSLIINPRFKNLSSIIDSRLDEAEKRENKTL